MLLVKTLTGKQVVLVIRTGSSIEQILRPTGHETDQCDQDQKGNQLQKQIVCKR